MNKSHEYQPLPEEEKIPRTITVKQALKTLHLDNLETKSLTFQMVSEAFSHLFNQELKTVPVGARSPRMIELAYAWDCFCQIHEATLDKAFDDLTKGKPADTIIQFLNNHGGRIASYTYMTPAQKIIQELLQLDQNFINAYKKPGEDNTVLIALKMQYEIDFNAIMLKVYSEFSSCSSDFIDGISEIYETLHLGIDKIVWNLNDFVEIDDTEDCLKRACQEQYDAYIATISALKDIHPEQAKTLNMFIKGLQDLRKDYIESPKIDEKEIDELTNRFSMLQQQAKKSFQEIPAIWESLGPCLQCLFKVLVIPYVLIQGADMIYRAGRSTFFQPIDDDIKETWDALQLDTMPKVPGFKNKPNS